MPSFHLVLLSLLAAAAQATLFVKKIPAAHVQATPLVAARQGQDPDTVQDEWFHRVVMGGRNLRASCDDDSVSACAFVSLFTDEVDVYGSCGGLAREKDDAWCYSEDFGEDVCCGDAEDCCEVKWGIVSVILIVLLLALVASICGCCYCCKCCCLYDKFHGNSENQNNGNAAPATVVTESMK